MLFLAFEQRHTLLLLTYVTVHAPMHFISLLRDIVCKSCSPYPTGIRTRIWDCNIYNNTFTVGTPPSRKTSILSQRRWDKPLELGGTTWFLPYTFGIASDLLSVTNTQRSLHIARLSDGASHDGNV